MSARVAPWWVEHGIEACCGCGQRCAYELQVRCVACDGPLCPVCLVRLTRTREASCSDCAREEERPAREEER